MINANIRTQFLLCKFPIQVLRLDLGSIVPCVSGPKRPHDRVDLDKLHSEFKEGLGAKISFKVSLAPVFPEKIIVMFQGFGLKPEELEKTVKFTVDGQETTLSHGSVVISAITSCTNTSNPSVMLAAGLVARKVGLLIRLETQRC